MTRKKLYQDHRRLNNKENRQYDKNRSYKNKIVSRVEKTLKELRMFVVDKRDAATLIPIIVRNCKPAGLQKKQILSTKKS